MTATDHCTASPNSDHTRIRDTLTGALTGVLVDRGIEKLKDRHDHKSSKGSNHEHDHDH